MNKGSFNNKIFIVILIILSCGILTKLIMNSCIYNLVDNRSSYRFATPSFKQILTSEYQNNFEDAIADQLPKYNYFKLLYLKVVNYINIGTIKLFKLDRLNRYIKMGNVNLYKGYLLYNNITNEAFQSMSDDDINEINNIYDKTNANIYLYFIETDSINNFETGYKVDALSYLKNNIKLNDDNMAFFAIPSFDEYANYFYKTDHHWNYIGADYGYREIASLMDFDYILDRNNEICFNKNMCGSKARIMAGIKIFMDRACVYSYNYPDFEIYIDSKKKDNYGSTIDEIEKIDELSYGKIYGGDFPEIIFINNESSNNKKLLIYANSFSNAINKLLASNYRETRVIDGRYYNNASMVDYINDNQIDDVLILANSMLFSDNIAW